MLRIKGFTLVEVILVILIIGILAGIVVPRITYSANEARKQACRANVSHMNSTIEYGHAIGSLALPSAIGDLNNTDWDDYFPDGVPAACDLGTDYAIDSTTGRVISHGH